jgi:predicted TIM-barrel fold metal-dependent hydrolase
MSDRDPTTAFGRIFAPRADWLARAGPEEILDADLPVIDTHHHLWNAPGRYLIDDLLADTSGGHAVEATVFVECGQNYLDHGPQASRPVGEVAWAARAAAECDASGRSRTRVAAGIVGYCDLTLGDRLEPIVTALIEAGGGRLRGVRNSAGWHADPVIGNNHHGVGPGHYLREDLRAGLRRLAALGLSLDALVYHHQHADLIDLARACPNASIIVNHTGLPLGYGPFAGKNAEIYAHWRTTIGLLAACPNVTMKLGGMMMRLAAFDYYALPSPPTSVALAAAWRPYIEACIELFGARRCTFESNFPVDKMGIGYAALWNAFKRLAAGASTDEKRELFSGTARRVYRL